MLTIQPRKQPAREPKAEVKTTDAYEAFEAKQQVVAAAARAELDAEQEEQRRAKAEAARKKKAEIEVRI